MSAPAGWYPDPAGQPGTRWWDGTRWTGHVAPAPTARGSVDYPPQAPGAAAGVVPAAGAAPFLPRVDVPTNTVWIWLAIAAAALPIAVFLVLDPSGYIAAMTRAETDPGSFVDASLAWTMQSLGLSLVSWVGIGVAIVLCWLDWRELRMRGVAQPFHWAWAFFALVGGGLAVYVIGRTVVLRRRTVAGGWPPLWTWIGVTALSIVVAVIWTVGFMRELFATVAVLS